MDYITERRKNNNITIKATLLIICFLFMALLLDSLVVELSCKFTSLWNRECNITNFFSDIFSLLGMVAISVFLILVYLIFRIYKIFSIMKVEK